MALSGWATLFYGRYLIERRLGLTLLLDRSNAVDWELHTSGFWEPESIGRLFALADRERGHRDGAVFLDIGAHWGFYALLARRKGWFERIVAFEPDPANYAQLQANLFLNGAGTEVEALKLAASDRPATFGLEVDSRNRGGARLVAAAHGTVTCQAVRVDSVVDVAGKLLVVKMDVENHEEAALDGLLPLLAKNHCVLQIEVWTGAESLDEDRPRRVIERLAKAGIRHVDTFDSDYFFVSEL
ncbi:MAG: FkbM family methyltransferase [Alphaproteobacteria bacterium]|nr:FkbM family methyltransferase [Alphaproteobacteria bacterium]